jgi:hypothetical protein
MSRSRHEHQVRLLDSYRGREFEQALNRVISRSSGFDWFTDEQIAEIRAEMIGREWFRHKLNRQNRRGA